LAKAAILSSTAWTPGTTFFAVDLKRGGARRPQRDVQDGPVLGDIDLVAAKHRVDLRPHAALAGQGEQQLHRFIGDAVFRVIEKDADGLGGEAFAALRVVGEELPKVKRLEFRVMTFKGLPGGAFRQRRQGGHGVTPIGTSEPVGWVEAERSPPLRR